jgi:hypothetical protein
MSETVDAASENRVVNNSFRHRDRVLNDKEKADMVRVKDAGLAFLQLLHEIGGTVPAGEMPIEGMHLASRNLSLSATHMEDAVMRAVCHITG